MRIAADLHFAGLVPLAMIALAVAGHVVPGMIREAWRNRKFPGRAG